MVSLRAGHTLRLFALVVRDPSVAAQALDHPSSRARALESGPVHAQSVMLRLPSKKDPLYGPAYQAARAFSSLDHHD